MNLKTIYKNSINRILILGSIGIGNLLMFSPCLRALRKAFPEAHIALIVLKKGFVELYNNEPNVDELIVADYSVQNTWGKRIRFMANLRKGNYDLCITTFPANRLEYNLLPYLAGIKYRIAHRYSTKYWRTCSFLQNYKIPVDIRFHDVEQNIALLQPLGIELDVDKKLYVTLSENNSSEAEQFLQDNHFGKNALCIGIHAGSSVERNMDLKRWDTEKFIALCKQIQSKYEVKFLVFGGPDENNIKHEVKKNLNDSCVSVENVSLITTAALIKRCHLVVTNDSGLMHVAVAMNVPCAAIFGPTDPGRTAPYGPEHKVIRLGLECSPCWSIRNVGVGRIKCIYSVNRCLKDLSVRHVYDVVDKMLSGMEKSETSISH